MYILVSSLRVVVIIAGLASWSKRSNAIPCRPLTSPNHGEVFEINDSLSSYWCYPGYKIAVGNRYRICGVDGQWSGEEAVCSGYLGATCKTLAPPTNGFIDCVSIPPKMSLGSTCYYQCNKGYEMEEGSKARQLCLISGKWSGTDVVCKPACEPLKVGGGFFNCTNGNKIGSVCRLFCEDEGMLEDYSHNYSDRECMGNRIWSGDDEYRIGDCPVGSRGDCPKTCQDYQKCLRTSSCRRCPSFANASIWLRVCGKS